MASGYRYSSRDIRSMGVLTIVPFAIFGGLAFLLYKALK